MTKVSLTESLFSAETDQPICHSTIGESLKQIASEFPRRVALVEITQTGNVGHRWTYGELYKQSQTLAQALANRFDKGEHIVVWSPNSPAWVLMEYAAFIRFHNQPATADALKTFCRERMSAQKTPTLWRRVEAFPLTGSGKIQKFKLREMELQGETLAID